MHNPQTRAEGERRVIVLCVVAAVALAWAYLLHESRQMSSAASYDQMMAAMDMPVDRAWTPADLVLTAAMWTVMMVGMMLPAATPVLLLYGNALRGRGTGHPRRDIFLFAAGYLLVWTLFSVAATLVQAGLHGAALLSPAMDLASPRLAGATVMTVGAYQLTPWKAGCLAHCRSPLGFLMTRWRDGAPGAVRMGAAHGWYCLGCCWALMALLFVVGVMNLTWVAALSVFVLLEKAGPVGAATARVAGTLMVALGLFLIVVQ